MKIALSSSIALNFFIYSVFSFFKSHKHQKKYLKLTEIVLRIYINGFKIIRSKYMKHIKKEPTRISKPHFNNCVPKQGESI